MVGACLMCLLLAVALVVRVLRGHVPWLTGAATLLLLVGTGATVAEVGPATVAAAPWFAAYPVLMATYPDGRFVPGWSIVPVALWAGLTAWFIVSGSQVSQEPWWIWLVFLTLFPALGFQVFRYRRRLSTVERERVRWAVLGGVIEFYGFALVFALLGDPGEGDALALAAANVAMLAIPTGLVLGLLSPRLVEVDWMLRMTVTVVTASGFLALVFGLALFVLGPWPAGTALALLTIPAGLAARRVAHWLVHGRLVSPAHAAAELQRRLDQLTPADDVAGVIVEQVREAIRSEEVHIKAGEQVVRGCQALPVTWHREQIATLWVAPRRSETALTRHDLATVAALLNRAAPALRGAQALHQLAEARAEVLRAREEERKRLRRDLHDDLGPTLASLGLGVSAMQAIAPPEAAELRAVGERVQQGIRDAIEQTRGLAHGLRPAILDDHGLVEALRQRAKMLDSAGIAVDLRSEISTPAPAAVELAALLITQEALANVVRHSAARFCRIALRSDPADLVIVIEDDGVGIRGCAGRGLGMDSMRARAAEIGGCTTVTSSPGTGTCVTVRLPTVPRKHGS